MTVTEATDVRGAAVLSADLSDGGPWRVHGVAIGNDELTRGMSGQKKYWPTEALREAAHTLEGKNIVRNHINNDVDAVVGGITEARHHPQYGVIYKGEVDDAELAKKIKRERIDVSPRIRHKHVDELEENDDGALVVDEIVEFSNLALVPRGAAESNKIRIGERGLLSQAELRAEFGDDTDDPQQDEELDIEDRVGGEEEVTETASLGDWDTAELADMAVHKPDYSGTTESEWNKPSKSDFDTEDLSEIADHFVASKSGFPPENFGDLALPVVEPDGTLNKNGVESARQMAGQVDGLSGDDLERVKSILSDLPPSDDDEEENAEEEPEETETAVLSELEILGVSEKGDVDISELEILH